MSNQLDELRKSVCGPHHKMPWAKRLKKIIDFVSTYPQYGPVIGLVPAESNAFFINSTLLARFFGFKDRNSVNRNFQQHAFTIDQTCNLPVELPKYCSQLIPFIKQWVKRVFVLGFFDDDATSLASNYAVDVRKGYAVTAPHLEINREGAEPEWDDFEEMNGFENFEWRIGDEKEANDQFPFS
jgi:hypothetical protein